MITYLEQALSAFLTARLAANESLAGMRYVVRPATEKSELPEDRHTVVCKVRGNQSRLRKLIDFDAACELFSPMRSTYVTGTTHAKLEEAIRVAWEGADDDDRVAAESAFDTAVQASVSGWHSGGLYPGDWEPANEENGWEPAYVISLGIAMDGV